MLLYAFIVTVFLTVAAAESTEEFCAKGPYNWVVIEGAGAPGLALVGAVEAARAAGLMKEIKGYAGSSSGSMVAAAYAAGMQEKEVIAAIGKIADIDIVPKVNTEAINGVVYSFGLQNGNNLRDAVDDLLFTKTGKKNITFSELKDLTNNTLKLTGACVSNSSLVYFSPSTSPDMPVSLAVRASSSIPFVFAPTEWKGDLYFDGGFVNDIPVGAWKNETGDMLVFTFTDEAEFGQHVDIKNVTDYLYGLYNTIEWGPDGNTALHLYEGAGRMFRMMTNITDIQAATNMSLGTIGTPTDEQTQYLLKQGGDSVAKYAAKCNISLS